ncbi:MAG: cyclic nucleotide-binding domain-containing protein [Methylocystis sp.]|nr:cyclic nucleotide-binding domain-containing protein [Methylocystis sp.]
MTLDDDIENLMRIPLFSTFEPAALRMLAFSAETRLLRPGDILFRRGDASDGGFILTMGAIGLDPNAPGSGYSRAPEIVVGPWALIGEVALITTTIRPSTAAAVEPSTVLKIGRTLFHQILEQHPATAVQVREFIRKRLTEFTNSMSGAQKQA